MGAGERLSLPVLIGVAAAAVGAGTQPVHRRGFRERADVWRMGICGAVISRTGKLRAIHRAMPPSSGRTRVTPRRWSCSATRALVASFGQEQ